MNLPYALIPIGIIVLFVYLLSYILLRLSVISLKSFRRFWNTIQLIAFFVTAILGLILVIQINYKLDIPFKEELLVWHVDFGIGMTIIVVFHFIWHWNYYRHIIKNPGRKSEDTTIQEQSFQKSSKDFSFLDLLPAFGLGFTTIITQIILLREFLTVFYGNELVIGIVLTNWMIITAIGAGIGRKTLTFRNDPVFQVSALILLSILALIMVILLNILKNVVFQAGSLVGIYQILLSSFVLMLPFCLLSGYLFTHLSVSFSDKFNRNMIHRTYAVESTGSLAGGIIVSFILVYLLKSLQILGILILLNVAISFLNRDIRTSFRLKWLFVLIALSLYIIICVFNIDKIVKKSLYPNQEIVYLRDTPYGNLTVTRSAEQLNFFENTSLLFTTNDPVSNEENVHYAMLQHPDPKNILIISGGISGIINEILKYQIDNIDYVEINPWIIKLGKRWTDTLDYEQVNVIIKDSKIYLNESERKYDVILMQIPEPNTAQVNRYYTLEYFKLLKKRLSQDGLVSLSLPSTVNYVSVEANELNSIVYRTLKSVFNNVLIVPGNKNYLLASDDNLNIDIPSLVEQKDIENVYVNQYYLDTWSLSERSDFIMEQLNQDAPVNKDFKPVCYFQHLKYWMSQFNVHYWLPFGLIVLVFLLSMIRLKPITFGMFAAGFAGSSIEMLLILTFQILYGYVYHYTGIIITAFMGGLAIGALYREKILKTSIQSFLSVQLIITLYALVLPLVFLLFNKTESAGLFMHVVFVLMTLIISVATGMQFSLGSTIMKEKMSVRSASLYSSDLVGSAFGALLVSVFMIPILGIIFSTFIIAALNLISASVTFVFRKNYVY